MSPIPLPSGFKERYGSLLFEGLPYRGKIMDRKEDDPDYRQPVLCADVKVKIFQLDKEDDLREWQGILQKVADGVATVSFEDKVYDKDIHSWRVLIRWMEHFYTNPEGDNNGSLINISPEERGS
jgi:hypothetical protein